MNRKVILLLVCGIIAALGIGIVIGAGLAHSTGGRPDSSKGSSDKTYGSKEDVIDTENLTDTESDGSEETGNGSMILSYVSDNSWPDGSLTMRGVNFRIANNSGEAVNGWELELAIEGLERVEGWNGTFKHDGDKLVITNVDYNKTIDAGGNVDFGCNMGVTGKDLIITRATLNGKECIMSAEKALGNDGNHGNKDNSGNTALTGEQTVQKSELLKRSDRSKQGDDWLHTDGRRILDKDGNEVWITGVNWFGYNTGTNTFDGLWNSRLEPTVKAIADHGFNLIRVPMSAQLFNEWAAGNYPTANYNHAYNENLDMMNSLEIFEYFLVLAENNGLKVMIDIHSAETDAAGHMTNLWYTGKVSDDEYLAALKWAAARYKDNDTVIAFDLKNEPHGKASEGDAAAVWNDSKAKNNWKYMAERAALTVLNENPNVLVLVEGVEAYPKNIKRNGDYSSRNDNDYYYNWWGGNLRGVRDYPVELGKYRDKLVYSPHDYGPLVYEQSWFKGGFTYDSLMKDCWRDNWFYIYEEDIAPIFIGEWGGFMRDSNLEWMTCLRKLITTHRLHHTFWCLNPNSGDTGGLLLDDFNTWDEEKYKFVKESLWQSNGKFVGLDHSIPLGENGCVMGE